MIIVFVVAYHLHAFGDIFNGYRAESREIVNNLGHSDRYEYSIPFVPLFCPFSLICSRLPKTRMLIKSDSGIDFIVNADSISVNSRNYRVFTKPDISGPE